MDAKKNIIDSYSKTYSTIKGKSPSTFVNISLGKDVILIGDRDVHHGEGKVFTLYKDGEEWHKGSPINYNYINEDGHFGHSISIDEKKALIGSRNGNVAVQYDFDTITHSWTESHVFSPYYYQSNGRFGFSVELAGKYAIIGSPGYDKKGFIEIHQFENETTVEPFFGLFFFL